MTDGNPRGRRWLRAAPWILLFVASAVLHLWDLGERSYHHDEAIHSKLAWNLAEHGSYRYDPTYHGPLQYYLVAATYHLIGDSDFTARLPLALTGMAMVLVAWCLRRPFGNRAAWWTGLLFTVSPYFLFFGRFLRMDLLEVALWSAAGVAWLAVLRGSQRAWVWLGVWIGLAFATKEGAYVIVALLGLCTALVALDVGPRQATVATWGWLRRQWTGVAVALAAFILVVIPLYTVGFTRPGDWLFPVDAIRYWWGQHTIQRVGGPWWYHLPRLLQYELLTLVAASAWVVRRWKRLRRVELFLYLFGVTSVLMYIYLGEKVPWLGVHQVWPFIPLAGAQLARTYGPRGRWWSRSLVTAGLAGTLVASFSVNFVLEEISPTDTRVESLHFVQTSPQLNALAREGLAVSVPDGSTVAAVGGEAVWPLTWYWRDLPVWWGDVQRGQRPPLVVCDVAKERELLALLGSGYRRETIPLRSWWLDHEGDPTVAQLARYYFTRVPWGAIGSTDVVVLRRSDEDRAVRRPADIPTGLAERLDVRRAEVIGEGWHGELRGLAAAGEAVAVADTSLSRVMLYPGGDEPPREVTATGGLFEPEAVAFTAGGRLVVADTWNHRLVELDPSGGPSRVLAAPDQGWYGPRALAVAADGRLAVADTGRKRIVLLDAAGSLLATLDGGGGFDEPGGLAWLDADTLLVCDTGHRRLVVLGVDDTVRRTVDLPEAWPDYYSRPQAVVLGPDRWLVSDTPAAALWLVTAEGVEALSLGPGVKPTGLALAPGGVLYVADLEGRLWRLELTDGPT